MSIEEILSKFKYGCGVEWVTPKASKEKIIQAKNQIQAHYKQMFKEGLKDDILCELDGYIQPGYRVEDNYAIIPIDELKEVLNRWVDSLLKEQ